MKKNIRYKIGFVILCGCIIAGAAANRIITQAVFDETSAVRYKEYAASHTIEQSVLFIGTYLIHAQSLTEELYEKAMDSASQTNQTEIYYKSELVDGEWFNITSATGLSEIAGEGALVEEAELADLLVTCYTGSDGITRNVKDGQSMIIYDSPSPYDLYQMQELESIRMQYDNTFSEESTGVEKYYYDILHKFFDLDFRSEATDSDEDIHFDFNLSSELIDDYDEQLGYLQQCYESLQKQDKKDLAQIVSTIMGKIDAQRRIEIFTVLSQEDNNLLEQLQNLCSGSGYVEEDYDNKQFVVNVDVMDAIGSSLSNCQDSYMEYCGNILEEGTTILKQAEYDKIMQVIELSKGGLTQALEDVLLEIQALQHIEDDVIADASAELERLDNELIDKAFSVYKQKLSQGAGSSYQALAAKGGSQAAKQKMLENQKTELDSIKTELQYLIGAKVKRMESGEAANYLYEQMDELQGLYELIQEDAFAPKANESLDAFSLWLENQAAFVEKESDNLTSDIEKLEQKKSELQVKQQQALDENDLSLSKKYDELIKQVDKQIHELEEELQEILHNPDSSPSEKAMAMNRAGSSTALHKINEMKKQALEAIAEGNIIGNQTLEQTINTLAALGAEQALKDIKEKVEASGATQAFMDILENAITESRNSSMHDKYGTAGSTNRADNAGNTQTDEATEEISQEQLLQEMEAVLGTEFENLEQSTQAAVIAALNQAGLDGNQAAAGLARNLLYTCLADGNPYAYKKLKGEAVAYIPLSVISMAGGYRYVYDDSNLQITLVKRSKNYGFTVYDKKIVLQGRDEKTMSEAVKLQDKLPYLAQADAATYFQCEAEYIEGTDYGICLTQAMQTQAEELLDTLKKGDR